MKTIKFSLFLFAICIALAASFAFNLPGKDAKAFNVYHYGLTSTSYENLKNPDNWQGPDLQCDADEDVIPCSIIYEGNNLGEYLESLGSAPAIMAEVDTFRGQ